MVINTGVLLNAPRSKSTCITKRVQRKESLLLAHCLRELYVETEEIDSEFADNFEISMNLRKEADYASIYDEESTGIVLQYAAVIFEKTRTLMKSERSEKSR